MIPTEWRKSVVVSVVAEPYKALCSIVHKGMMKVVEEKGLVAEEQGFFEGAEAARIRLSHYTVTRADESPVQKGNACNLY